MQKLTVIKDRTYAAVTEEGKPYKKKGTSMFVTLTKPHGSMSASTVRSEAKKYLDRIEKNTSSRLLRHSIPSLIQLIDNLSDAKTASKFRWFRTDTYKKWYKSEIPESVRAKFLSVNLDFPMSWKIRHIYIDKSRVKHYVKVKPTESREKSTTSITNYFSKE